MAMQRHMTRAELIRSISTHRNTIKKLNEANVDAAPNGGTLTYFALDDILLVGQGHDTVTGWIGMCEEANSDLIGGKMTVSKAGRVGSGTLTLTHNKASREQRKAIEKEIGRFSNKDVKWEQV